MPIDAAQATSAEPRTTDLAWEPKDVLLYHLGIGAGVPATDPGELRYTLESKLHVLPSFATVAGGGMALAGGLGAPGIDVDLAAVLHGGQTVTLHRPIPVRGRAVQTSTVPAVYNKGKAAVIVLRTETADDDGPLWTCDTQIFVKGEGGFGGEAGAVQPADAARARAGPYRRAARTRRPRRFFSRLSGDLEPAARRARLRQARRLRPADPARTLHVWHHAEGGGGRGAGRRRGARRRVLDPVRRGGLPRRDAARTHVAGARTGPGVGHGGRPGRRAGSGGHRRHHQPVGRVRTFPGRPGPAADHPTPPPREGSAPCAQRFSTRQGRRSWKSSTVSRRWGSGQGKVRIRIRATGLCHSDLSAMSGVLPASPRRSSPGTRARARSRRAARAFQGLAAGDRVLMCWLPACGTCPASPASAARPGCAWPGS
ncbi:hypothetical protein SRIMM317S_03290 [Streptomyces rimosus subsp. rimosus]